jgi:hypothetical protein
VGDIDPLLAPKPDGRFQAEDGVSRERGDHQHTPRKAAGGPNDGGGLDWFAAFDVAVWAAVAVIGILALEWLIGKVVRDSIANGAAKYLKKQAEEPAG